jgi:hypothetical protein
MRSGFSPSTIATLTSCFKLSVAATRRKAWCSPRNLAFGERHTIFPSATCATAVYNTAHTDRGSAAFGGHIAGDECVDDPTAGSVIHCATGVYLWRAGGPIISVAHARDAASGGGVFMVMSFV